MLLPIDQNTGNNGYQETENPILAHPGLRALLQQQIAIRDGAPPAGTPAPAMMPSSSAAGPTAPPITPSLPDTPLSQQALPSSPQPKVVGPTKNEATLYNLQNSKPGLENVYGKITSSDWGQNHPGLGKLAGIAGQIPATAADLALSLKNLPVLGNSLSSIGQVMPGTTEQHNAKLGEAAGAVTADEVNAEKEAQAQNLKSEVPLHSAQAGYYGAHAEAIGNHQVTPEEAAAMGNPDLAGSQMDPKAWEQLIKQHGINANKVKTTEMTVQGRQDVADANNLTKEKVAQLKPEQRDDHAIRIMGLPPEQRTQQDNAYLAAYSRYVDMTKTQPGIARAEAFGMFRPVQTIDPETGDVHYDFAGNAIKSGAASPSSMNFRTGVGMAKFMTSGKGGQTITAYNTANDHLDLLGKAMDALQNGDVQRLNQLDNAFKQEFGHAAPTNVNAIKAMLAGELANVAKVTGATDQEIKVQQDNINRAASNEQIKGFIDTNHDLMDQKAFEMYQQYQNGMQGKPAFGTGRPLKGPGGNQPAQGSAPQRPASVPPGYNWNPQGNGGKGSWQPPKQ